MPRLLFLALALLLIHPANGFAATYASGQIVVKFKETAELRSIDSTNRLAHLNALLNLPGAKLRETRLREALRQRRHQALNRNDEAPLDRFFQLQLPPGLSVLEAVTRLRQHPLVDYAEPDGIGTGGATIPNDPSFAQQWHHQNLEKLGADLHSTEAWDITTGSTNIVVALLDTGIALQLNEFAGRIVPGYDFVNNDSDPADDNGHGTAVAAVLGANANNNSLIAGVDWHCRLMPVKVLDNANFGFYSNWANGIDFAVSNGCKIINLSAGGDTDSEAVRRAITNAIAHGVIFVTITHNQGTGILTFPGRMPEAITTGATDQADHRTSFSNYGPGIDLVAPGIDILTIWMNGDLRNWFGTSFSAPLVSGVCALMASLDPALTQDQARLILALGAEDQVGDGSDTPGFDNYYGWGRLNAYHSVLLTHTRLQATVSTNLTPEFSWSSPNNAVLKEPYRIEAAAAPDGPWNDVTISGEFFYQGARASWSAATNVTGSYYRLRLRTLP